MNRRDFLCYLASAGASTAAFLYANPLRPRLGFAQIGTGKTLVVVFQRGGCDGLNTVIPYGDGEYYNLRPTLAIAAPNAGNPASALDLDGFFGLHPSLAGLRQIYSAGQLAVLPAVHYPNGSQSHFDGQQYIESAASRDDIDGWLNRHLVTLPVPAALRAAAFGSSLPQSLRGQVIVSAFDDVAAFTLSLPAAEEQALLADLGQVYSQNPTDARAYRSLVLENGRALVNDLAVVSGVNTSTYQPENGAVYPSSTFGRQLKQIAQLIKEGIGLEVATISIGGWDTHSNQGGSSGSQASRHADFANGIAAFHTDLATDTSDVVLMTMTEFGRTSAENGSLGTDHGKASAWFVAGKNVQGGIYGTWPGLAPANLVNGRYLAHSIDYRDVMGEVLANHLGNTNLATLLPGYSAQPVGFL